MVDKSLAKWSILQVLKLGLSLQERSISFWCVHELCISGPDGAVFDVGWLNVGFSNVDDGVPDDDVTDATGEATVDTNAGSDAVLLAVDAAKVQRRSVVNRFIVQCVIGLLPPSMSDL